MTMMITEIDRLWERKKAASEQEAAQRSRSCFIENRNTEPNLKP
jgi:hypothetical protein